MRSAYFGGRVTTFGMAHQPSRASGTDRGSEFEKGSECLVITPGYTKPPIFVGISPGKPVPSSCPLPRNPPALRSADISRFPSRVMFYRRTDEKCE